MKRLRLAVLVSGSGRSLRNLLELGAVGNLPGHVDLVIASRADAGALHHAQIFGVPSRVCKTSEVTAALDAVDPDLVVMAGYLKMWPLPEHYEGRTINIHPSLLPLFGGKGFYGHHVHQAVIESGMKVSGCTVHFVTAEYDQGPIIIQRTCPVLDDDSADSLATRVFTEELKALPEAISLFAEERLRVEGRRVRVLSPPDGLRR